METNALIGFNNLLTVLDEYRMEVEEIYRQNLVAGDHVATGDLIKNITYRIEQGLGQIEVTLSLEDYWKWVENDTKPHFPPLDKILEWVKVKPVLPVTSYNGKLPTQEQLAFLIARKISEKGTEGTHDLDRAITEANERFEQRIGEAISMDINSVVSGILGGLQTT